MKDEPKDGAIEQPAVMQSYWVQHKDSRTIIAETRSTEHNNSMYHNYWWWPIEKREPYIPAPKPQWDWQDGKFSPAEGVEIQIERQTFGYYMRLRMHNHEEVAVATFMPHLQTDEDAMIAAEKWWADLKELVNATN